MKQTPSNTTEIPATAQMIFRIISSTAMLDRWPTVRDMRLEMQRNQTRVFFAGKLQHIFKWKKIKQVV